jgi:hypothetical protein
MSDETQHIIADVMPVHPIVERLQASIANALHSVRAQTLPKVCRELGLEEGTEAEAFASKMTYVRKRLTFDREALLELAKKVYTSFPDYKLEETLWTIEEEANQSRVTTESTRRNVLGAAFGRADIEGRLRVIPTLENAMPGGIPKDLRNWVYGDGWPYGDDNAPYLDNPQYDILIERLGLLDLSERRFFLVLEALSNPPARFPEDGQQEFVGALNQHLRRDKLELRHVNEASGYPVFGVMVIEATRGVAGRPKNIIFASSIKPDLRFSDAINNDVEIVSHVDEVLVFDRPIPADGLRWRDLQAWWAEKQNLEPTERETKVSLYDRLRSSLPRESPPQRLFFHTFYKLYNETFTDLPALLPEVWHHYDPKTRAERGCDALRGQRMDFLMLFSHGARIVIEVDGKQHYADAAGKADPKIYAKMAAADRELRLAGYEVYRFGGAELQPGPDAELVVRSFFNSLFAKHPA